MTLYLARHGRTLGEGLFLGQSDPELSDEGRNQSFALAALLADAGVASIQCSGLRRSIETARIVGGVLDAPVEPDARWNELGYGLWDGLAWAEIERRWPDEAQRKLADWWAVTPEGGETRDAFEARIREALSDLCARKSPAVLVGHAGVNGLVAELARGRGTVDWDRVTGFGQDYGDVLRLEVE